MKQDILRRLNDCTAPHPSPLIPSPPHMAPPRSQAFYNWAIAISDRAKIRGRTAEAEALWKEVRRGGKGRGEEGRGGDQRGGEGVRDH